jgi:3-hydroxybutyryl-CoA dehydrogenase
MNLVREDAVPVFGRVGIIGAGAMGRGIAQMCLLAGSQVVLLDSNAAALEAAKTSIDTGSKKWFERGKLSGDEQARLMARLTLAHQVTDLAMCDLVLEAIIEDLASKRKLLAQLETVVAADCVIASNTSSLSIAALAGASSRPAQIAGWHFFNPVPLMRLVEVIAGPRTDAAVCERLIAYTKQFGHVPVQAKDSPGFIVNHAGRAYGTEALAIIGEGVADFATVDRIMRAMGFRLGPFELMDLTALDVSHPVMESVYRQFYDEPRFRPSAITAQRLAAGLLGRKAGQGFYTYGADAHVPAAPAVPAAAIRPIWLAPDARQNMPSLPALLDAAGVVIDRGLRPDHESIVLLAPLGHDLTTALAKTRLLAHAHQALAVDPVMPCAAGATMALMRCPATAVDFANSAHAALAQAGLKIEPIRDSAGFVAQRIIALMIAVACEIAQKRIAAPLDIDTAVTLGLAYPRGPLQWGDELNAQMNPQFAAQPEQAGQVVAQILAGMHEVTQDPRYRPSLWLARRAKLGLSLHTPEL